MRRARIVAAALVLTGASSPSAERVVSGDGVVPVSVNGVAGRLRIDPSAPGLPMLAPGFAADIKPKGGGLMTFGVTYHVGPERIHGPTKVVRIGLNGGRPAKQRAAWPERAYAPGIDAVVGPAGVDAPVVRFVLRPARPGERTVALPMAEVGGMFASWFGTFAEISVGGAPMLVRFAPLHARTVANAGAAQRLAAAHGGRLGGTSGVEEIAFGIERPVRDLTLAQPVAIGPLLLAALVVRTADGGSVAAIPSGAAAADPDEVVVVGKSKTHDLRRDRLTLGADQLDRCSSIVFDKAARQVRLSCLP